MIFRNPDILILLFVLPVIVVILWLWRGRRLPIASLLLRLGTVTFLILALANPLSGQEVPTESMVVILVDQSDSLTADGKVALQSEARRLAYLLNQDAGEDQPGARRTAILWFGANVVAPDEDNLQSVSSALNPAGTNIAEALRRAQDMLASTGGRIILLSDGMQTTGDALREAERAAVVGIPIDVWSIEPYQHPDLYIARLHAPHSMYEHQNNDVEIVVGYIPGTGSRSTASATLRVWEGERLLDEQPVLLEAGLNTFPFTIQATSAGVMQVRAEIVGEPDTFERNNQAAAAITVTPAPRVLLVEGRSGNGQELNAALQRGGIDVQTMPATQLPSRLSELEPYAGMVLVDVPVSVLSLDQMTSVREFVRSEGRGLVVTGGRNSFGLGAYKDTPLEHVLPVLMDPPPRPQRPEISLLLVIDRSASMTAAYGVTKFDMAKEAAILSTEALRQNDRIGILAFDTRQDWVVPFQPIGQGLSLKEIQDAIATLPIGGGTDIFGALNIGMGELARQPTTTRHTVLLTDGRSFTSDRVAYRQLIDAARSMNMTLSTVAIGQDADLELLDILAQWGGGRYYYASHPDDIPRLTLRESEIANSDPTVEERFRADVATAHPLLRGFAPANLPDLSGYVATTPKEAADVVLRSPIEDPVLSTWQYGLGRAVAWTPSIAEPWADPWLNWPDYSRFWSQVVRYTLPEPDSSGPLQVRVVSQGNDVQLVVEAVQAGSVPIDLATVNARVTLPDGTQSEIRLPQIAPGRYARDLLLPRDGAYAVEVVLERDAIRYETQIGHVQPVPAEYMPMDATGGLLQGIPLLEAIAQHTGGQVLNTNAGVPLTTETTNGIPTPHQLWPWLLGAALVLWVLEIAVRRGLFIRR